MNLKLRITKHDFPSEGKQIRLAVIDLDKSEEYPRNFVCMLPCRMRLENDNPDCVFQRVFGDRSLEQAKELLAGALETEDDIEVKAEIERRLKTFEPKQAVDTRCGGCGRLFQPLHLNRYGRNFCPECKRKKYGG